LCALLLILVPAVAQEQGAAPTGSTAEAAALGKRLDGYRQHHLQEKLFLHTDKEFYLAGEICWFKVYTVDGGSQTPIDLSKVAYLEWLDKDNKPVLQAKVGLGGGHGDGSVYLPLSLRSGNYKLRAYTNWMKNFDADWFFEKTVTIINARRSSDIPVAEGAPQYHVDFFPEGGNLVENIPCRIGFRITDAYGRGLECTGVVTEDDQDTIIRMSPHRFGIGQFPLTPRPGHHYRTVFRLPDGTAVANLLPKAAAEGVVMSVVPEGNEAWRVTVQASGPGAGASGPTGNPVMVYLIAHTRQSVKTAEAAPLVEGKASFRIDKNALGEGISHLTVFNAERQPVCERLVFKQPSKTLKIMVQPDSLSYRQRQKINLKVDAGDGKADCSLSVFRADDLQGNAQSHIESYLWLASDLKGRIESPDYYFDHPEDMEAMDNLMLTHGWRRFHWGDVLTSQPRQPEFPPEYNGAIISGRLLDNHTGAPAKGIEAYLSVPGTRTQFTSVYSDDEGHLRFELRDFYGGQEIILQTNPRDSTYRVEVANPFAEAYTADSLSPIRLSKNDSDILAEKSENMEVLNRYAGERLKRMHVPTGFDTTAFYYQADKSYLLDDYTRFTTMEEVMREYVTLMLVRVQNGHYHLPLFELPYSQFFESDPLILLDGVPVFNIDSLMVLDPLKIRKLETLQRKVFLGGTYFPGVMNWTTYKGDLGGYILDPRSTVVDYEGLALQREFYSPSYATEEQLDSHLPDFRNVLYWSPAVPVNGTGKGGLSFYSSDLPGKYFVVVEGIAADGTAGSGVVSFEVR
jgi:5-hydroxyisourate hydrolase-like protein (transthyretin family)